MMIEYESRRGDRAAYRRKWHERANTIPLKSVLLDMTRELEHAYAHMRTEGPVPPLSELVQALVSGHFKDSQKTKGLVQITLESASHWDMPQIEYALPDPREAAIEKTTVEEAISLNKKWDVPLFKSVLPSDRDSNPFFRLLIACRALLLVEKYPDLYRFDRKKAVRREAEEIPPEFEKNKEDE